ncbi:ureidoglycolate hydrolase [Lampropedia puyangensis]|uniref:Ureidoglycolate hydrolase n=1 Tax=Lampropedia puyangensis TaxID=1330072 RepID=A0A4S8FDJ2_9BURK|nr:ureidoglycolate lyase [Lampropedia puyangensis]THU05349.1 ureidoglycolate hydrolase [Lampropedia puyangensis]
MPALPTTHWLTVQPLTAESFAPFGQVIECKGHCSFPINGGTCQRYHDLAQPQLRAEGRIGMSLFHAQALPWNLPLQVLERHAYTSQAFVPMGQALPMLVVVAPADVPAYALQPPHVQAFLSDGQQGINLAPGTWHHPLRTLKEGTWLVVDRIAPPGSPVDCEEHDIGNWDLVCAR